MPSPIRGYLDRVRDSIERRDTPGLLMQVSDLGFAGIVASLVALIIIPLPTWLLDILLTTNIAFAMTMLLAALYISKGTRISVFPTLILIATLLRLALEISATRLILLHADAGEVVRAFGEFVVQGNLVVGLVIFLIITLIQLIVVSKGAERAAEVTARFVNDSLSARMSSIEYETRAGLPAEEAQKRRRELNLEMQFFSRMTGAITFVKGDAIGSLIISAINIVGGLLVGVLQQGMPLAEALQTYTILTVGSGLVSQIPAIVIAISSGLVISLVSDDRESTVGQGTTEQLLALPKALGVAAILLVLIGLVPGMPAIPFLLLAAILGWISWQTVVGARPRKARGRKADEEEEDETEATPLQPSLVSEITLEIGEDLLTEKSLRQVRKRSTQIRRELYASLGILFPEPDITGGYPGRFRVLLSGVEFQKVNVAPGHSVVLIDPSPLRPRPAWETDCEWYRGAARARWAPSQALASYPAESVYSPAEAAVLAMAEVLRRNPRPFLSVQELSTHLDVLRAEAPKLVEAATTKASVPQIASAMADLVEEGVSVRDLRTILRATLSHSDKTGPLSETMRVHLAQAICKDIEKSIFYYLPDALEKRLQTLWASPSFSRENPNPPTESVIVHELLGCLKMADRGPDRSKPLVLVVRNAGLRYPVYFFARRHLGSRDVVVLKESEVVTSNPYREELESIPKQQSGQGR